MLQVAHSTYVLGYAAHKYLGKTGWINTDRALLFLHVCQLTPTRDTCYLLYNSFHKSLYEGDTRLEGKSCQIQAEGLPQAGPSLHWAQSHTAVQPGRHGRTRCGQVREGGQGLTEAWEQSSLAAPGSWRCVVHSKAVRRGWVEGALQFRKSLKFVLLWQKSKPGLTRHKVGNLLANL